MCHAMQTHVGVQHSFVCKRPGEQLEMPLGTLLFSLNEPPQHAKLPGLLMPLWFPLSLVDEH